MKKMFLLLSVMMMSILMSMTAFAGVWRTGVTPNEDRWWYDNEDGTWAEGGWQWNLRKPWRDPEELPGGECSGRTAGQRHQRHRALAEKSGTDRLIRNANFIFD